MTPHAVAQVVALVVAAAAAVQDHRTGHIPNWITAPPLLLAPVGWLVAGGVTAGLLSAGAIAVCGLVPFVLWRSGAMGGGDVKLLAALGALIGISAGVEAQLVAFMAASVFSVGRLVWHGRLTRMLRNTALIVVNPLRRRDRRVEVEPELLTEIRLGVPAFVGTLFAVLSRSGGGLL